MTWIYLIGGVVLTVVALQLLGIIKIKFDINFDINREDQFGNRIEK